METRFNWFPRHYSKLPSVKVQKIDTKVKKQTVKKHFFVVANLSFRETKSSLTKKFRFFLYLLRWRHVSQQYYVKVLNFYIMKLYHKNKLRTFVM